MAVNTLYTARFNTLLGWIDHQPIDHKSTAARDRNGDLSIIWLIILHKRAPTTSHLCDIDIDSMLQILGYLSNSVERLEFKLIFCSSANHDEQNILGEVSKNVLLIVLLVGVM